MHKYPFESALRKELLKYTEGVDYTIWAHGDILEKIKNNELPIVEIGGPTDTGYVFLEGVELDSKPIITNISDNPLPDADNAEELKTYVNSQVDGTAMPFEDSSVGIFLMHCMSISSDWWVELSDEEKEKFRPQFNREFSIASLEMGQVAAGWRDINDVHYSQRLKIFKEVKRCLRAGGLFFTNGGLEELIVLQNYGFRTIACLQICEGSSNSYEFVIEKIDS